MGQTAWNSLRAANWSKNEDVAGKAIRGTVADSHTPLSTLMARKRGGKEQTATLNR